jgi:hypothetical protein
VGLNALWLEDFFFTIQAYFQHDIAVIASQPYNIVQLSNKVFIHLVPLQNSFSARSLIELQKKYQNQGMQLFHLWEDIWLSRKMQVLSRIQSFCGQNTTVHGRKCQIKSLETKEAKLFLDQNHLQGFVKAKYFFSLFYNHEIVAVAGFSNPISMKSKRADYFSAELIRFASKTGITITGGLSKLIKYYLSEVKTDDLMTYADRDWSIGNGYYKLGFQLTNSTPPAFIYVDLKTLTRYFPHRLPKYLIKKFEEQSEVNLDNFLKAQGFEKVFNTGNLKYYLYL